MRKTPVVVLVAMGAVISLGQATAPTPNPEGKRLEPSTIVENREIVNWEGGKGPAGTTGGGRIELMCLSADGQHVLFKRTYTGLKLADVTTGNVLHDIPINGFSLNSLTVSRDGKRVAAGTNTGKAILWNAAKMEPLKELQVGKISIFAVAMTPDGRFLAADTGEGPVVLWDVEKGAKIRELGVKSEKSERMADVRFSDDGRLLAGYSRYGRLQVWEIGAGTAPENPAEMVKALSDADFPRREAAQKQLEGMGFNQREALQKLASATSDAEAQSRLNERLRAIDDGYQWSSPRSADSNNRIRILPDTKAFVMLGEGIRQCDFPPHGSADLPHAVTYPDWIRPGKGRDLAEGAVRGPGIGRGLAPEEAMRDELSADGTTAASLQANGMIAVWNFKTREIQYTLTGKRENQVHGGGVRQIAITADGKRVACGLDNGTVEIWELAGQGAK